MIVQCYPDVFTEKLGTMRNFTATLHYGTCVLQTEVSTVCPEGFHHQGAGSAQVGGDITKRQLQ